eukprot:2626908-Prymnesium_polylepis.1
MLSLSGGEEQLGGGPLRGPFVWTKRDVGQRVDRGPMSKRVRSNPAIRVPSGSALPALALH